MLIGEVAHEAGVTRDAVRLYTRLGLVRCTQRQAGSRSYADYDESAVELVKGIKIGQSIGFTLPDNDNPANPTHIIIVQPGLDDTIRPDPAPAPGA